MLMHLTLWGQTQIFWIIALIGDSERTRMWYFQSSYLTAFIPYIGMPVYIFWLAGFHLGSNDGTYTFEYVVGNVLACFLYMLLVRFYSSNILTSLNNYDMILKTQRL